MKKEIIELSTITRFSCIISKLYDGSALSDEEIEYILGCAILLLDKYNRTNNRELFELAYNIILRYSISSGNYNPLYDISCNYGFYPTVRFMNIRKSRKNFLVGDAIIDFQLNKYKNETYIETFEQYKTRREIINSKKRNISFVAPTSSGKSSLIIQHLKKYPNLKKALVIVPTKSLIEQTYIEFRKELYDRKVISHDSMYKKEEFFVGIMTQERTARLLENNEELVIDTIYVDEAHNIFSNDPRNILLSRVIKLCKMRNEKLQTIYLSPFISDSKNLLQDENSDIDEQRIHFNIKEPNIFEVRKNGAIVTYDRFSDRFYDIGICEDYFKYIANNIKSKNFFFVNSPKKIELFAEKLYQNTDEILMDKKIIELQTLLAQMVHPEFNMIKYLKHGIIYLHARMPDQIKEYLEYQFKVNSSIKYLVANSVILEGINLPIDSLFIFDVWNMNSSKLLNLFGRVNRLNNVFDIEKGSINMLLPEIHFINSEFYRYEMKKKIEKLYIKSHDEVLNPNLQNYSLESIQTQKREKVKVKNAEIIEQEKVYFSAPQNEIDKLRRALIASGMNQLVDVSEENTERIMKKLEKIDISKPLIEIISDVFIKGITVIDFAFARLKNEAAIKYYNYFIEISKKSNLSSIIESQLKYYQNRKEEKLNYMYIGTTYGENFGPYSENDAKGKVYVDLRNKSKSELINLLIVKTKVEQDFISFQYNRAINFLHDNKFIDDNTYYMEIYGTSDEKKIQLLNLGITVGLINVLTENNQLKNIYINDYGNLMGNKNLKIFFERQNDYVKYEMNKFFYFD